MYLYFEASLNIVLEALITEENVSGTFRILNIRKSAKKPLPSHRAQIRPKGIVVLQNADPEEPIDKALWFCNASVLKQLQMSYKIGDTVKLDITGAKPFHQKTREGAHATGRGEKRAVQATTSSTVTINGEEYAPEKSKKPTKTPPTVGFKKQKAPTELKGGLGGGGGFGDLLGAFSQQEEPQPEPEQPQPATTPAQLQKIIIPAQPQKIIEVDLDAKGHELRQQINTEIEAGTGIMLPMHDIALPEQQRVNTLGRELGPESEAEPRQQTRRPISDTQIRKILSAIYTIAGKENFSWVTDENKVLTALEVEGETIPLLDLDKWATEKYGITYLDEYWLHKVGNQFQEILESGAVESPTPFPEFGPGYSAIESKNRSNSVMLFSDQPDNMIYIVAKEIWLGYTTDDWDMAIPEFLSNPARYVGSEIFQATHRRPRLALRRFLVQTRQGFAVARHGEAAPDIIKAYATGREANPELIRLMGGERFRERMGDDPAILESRCWSKVRLMDRWHQATSLNSF